jgi:acyl-CoA synthetase (AMP-forming)/AMP-acid ligase II
MRRVVAEMHMAEVTICYGMTETSPVSFQSSTTDPLERRVSTVGRIHPCLEVKLVDEQGRIVPRGTPGELCTRGYSVMRGYWDDPERTAEAIDPARWMHTGDLAIIDEEGYCNIVGRLKDMVRFRSGSVRNSGLRSAGAIADARERLATGAFCRQAHLPSRDANADEDLNDATPS